MLFTSRFLISRFILTRFIISRFKISGLYCIVISLQSLSDVLVSVRDAVSATHVVPVGDERAVLGGHVSADVALHVGRQRCNTHAH